MRFKDFGAGIKDIRDGMGNISVRGVEANRIPSRGRSLIAPEFSSPAPLVTQQSPWANLPSELLLDMIQRVEASETSWPARRAVVACASVCRSWRKITEEVVKTPEQCGCLTFPISLKQPGPRETPIQCFIKRERVTSKYLLYLGPSPALSGDMSKLLLAAKKIRRTTCTEFIISLVADDFSKASNTYVGKLSSNFLGTKFMILDSQLPPDSSLLPNSKLQQRIHSKHVLPKTAGAKHDVATISYELNVLRTRGPRRRRCTMLQFQYLPSKKGALLPLL